MINKYYSASCSICGRDFAQGEVLFVDSTKNEMINRLRRYQWEYCVMLQWVLCPECNEKFEMPDPIVKWEGEQTTLSTFCCKETAISCLPEEKEDLGGDIPF